MEITKFMKYVYFEKFGIELEIPTIHVDFFAHPRGVFKNPGHFVLRARNSVFFNYRTKVDSTFWKDPVLLKVWRVVTGCIF